MSDASAKAAARARVAALVENFQRNEGDYLRSSYSETQARTEFITPLLEAFGWDVCNAKGQPLAFREVIEEATVEVGEEPGSKKPDYELRLARQRKMFVEAKKPSVGIQRARPPAFQVRRYGYSASLPVSVLTNFHCLAVYDCRVAPAEDNEAHVARLHLFEYGEFDARFDELWDILSREVVYSGDFDRRFAVRAARHGSAPFDEYFLRQVRTWRERLAIDIHDNTAGLTETELTHAVQTFLCRIVFLRICEDRDIEGYESLRGLDAANTFSELMQVLRIADDFYDSGLFRLLDDAALDIQISDAVLRSIIEELYYPQSPYTFAVVETEVLGKIYEQFLGEVIAVADGDVTVVRKPEVRAGGGVVPTPRFIVDAIVEHALLPVLNQRGPADLTDFAVADICCGSGLFLLSAYELLLDHYLTWYLSNGNARHVGREIYEVAAGKWRLTLEEKRRILLGHIRGVDIDSNAVQVAGFSLLLKLIEHETAEGLRDYVDRHGTPALPSLDGIIRCGNSLVSHAEWESAEGAMTPLLMDKVNPFTWADEFPNEIERGGFDVVVGNPPYVRIQNMVAYSPEEVAFYQSPASPYSTARQEGFDKYALFIERALTLLGPKGRLGVIVPHKFMTIQTGRALRRLLTAEPLLEEITHFGVQQVFGTDATNYTCILVLDRRGRESVHFQQVEQVEEWRYVRAGATRDILASDLSEEPWLFADAPTRALFDRVRADFPHNLIQLAEIFVGVQTSADEIYMFPASHETRETIGLRWCGQDWPIERGILRPCLHDVALSAYGRPRPNEWMIFPYRLVGSRSRARARLIQPAEMARCFPVCWSYLNARREELERRNVTGGIASERQWYQFGRSQSLTKFDGSKIILPILSLEPRYAYDDSNIVVTGGGNGPYYLIRSRDDTAVSNHYLLAVMNHPLSEAFVRTSTSPFRGGYYSHGKQFIKDLPIPLPDESERKAIESRVRDVIDMLEAVAAARTPQERAVRERCAEDLRAQIEECVTALFGLSVVEMDTVQAVPVPA